MINRCINCGYFISCNRASEEIRNCEYFIKGVIKMSKIIERRKIKASFGKNGKGYKTSKISIPSAYFRFLGISEENNSCNVTLYENKIEIKKGEE